MKKYMIALVLLATSCVAMDSNREIKLLEYKIKALKLKSEIVRLEQETAHLDAHVKTLKMRKLERMKQQALDLRREMDFLRRST